MTLSRFFIVGLLLVSAARGAVGQTAAPAHPTAHQWESEIRAFEEADRRAPPPRGAVLFVGSSSIRLWKTLAEDFPTTKVINRGFGGSHLADAVYYADRIVIPYRPRLILLYAGSNDLAAGKSPERVFEDYREFVEKVRRQLPPTRIAYISIAPNPARWHLVSQMRAVNDLIRTYTARDRRLIYIDVFAAMLGPDGKPRPELFIEDKLHMNATGYRLWRSIIAPYRR